MRVICVAVLLSGVSAIVTPVNNGLDQLIRAASATCDALPLETIFNWVSVPDLEIMEYSRHGKRTYKLSKAHAILRYRMPQVLIFYIPGWWNTPTDESSQTLAKALLNKNSLFLILDTRVTFCRGYISSASRIKGVAQKVFKFIKNLYNDRYPLSSVHLIGFSLGAHVSGMVGKLVQNRLNRKIGKITALDPARPCFTQPSKYRLDKRDAKFVHVIHTSAGVLGLEQPIGHTDVYVNGVSAPQPECREKAVSLECDHAQAWKLFSASVMNERALIGRRCKSWNELSSDRCSGNDTLVGYGCNADLRGMFLYKSQDTSRRINVFNPFDIKTWWTS
ncbi:unnamed protein product [Euphydryas editha]|uniref:Lipase domain-containing protein n=1 Tax=Euphydryas editha TaxID=104508 RepID=A0AAU9U4V0_EUPED|nr:unnamed protein product [Euphydryas editha]